MSEKTSKGGCLKHGPFESSGHTTETCPDLISENENRKNEKFKTFSCKVEQSTTRGDGKLETGEGFLKNEIDFSSSLDHLKIHHSGEVAGSQINGEIFSGPDDVREMLLAILPDNLNFDQFNRCELTLEIAHEEKGPIGWSGVKTIGELKNIFPDVLIEQKMRMPGGLEGEIDGVEGAWFPETARNEKGSFEVVKDNAGNIKNPKAKFEPLANIATVSKERFQDASKTDKLTIILQKDKKTGKPTVLTIFPGENAPPFPAKIDTSDYKADNLNGPESEFWKERVFIKTK